MRRTATLITTGLLCVFALAGCVTDGVGTAPAAEAVSPPATLAEGLEHGYRMLAEYEAYVQENEESAAHFRAKADAAKAGNTVVPDEPVAKNAAMVQAHAMLTDARQTLSSGANALHIAEAQVNFDCWAGRQKSGESGGKGCRDRFYGAINDVDLRRTRYAVYFGVNQEVPDSAAQAIIRKVADAFTDRQTWRIHLTGHTDSKGSKSENLLKSMRRALAVRNALVQQGVEFDKIVIDAAGAEKTADPDDANFARRVDIAIIPAYLSHKSGKGPDIRKIAPQYFGSDEPDL